MGLGQESLTILPTRDTPEVIFDTFRGVLSIKGRCYPSDVKKFFEPILSWLQEYVDNPIALSTAVHIDLEYFNTTSGKVILSMFETLNTLYQKNHQTSVKWYEWEADEEKDDEYSFLDEFEGEYPFVEIIYK